MIEGIYDYCHRWCERCPFTSQCALAQMESAFPSGEPFEDTLERVDQMMADAQELMLFRALEAGIDLSEPRPVPPEVLDDPLRDRAMLWSLDCYQWLQRHESRALSPAAREAIDVVRWYHTLVATKVARAVAQSIDDWDGYGHVDAAGSAKVAWLGLGQMITALSEAYEAFGADPHTLQILLDTHALSHAVDRAFPAHRDFKRAGWDS